jgi:DNA polymerase IV
VVEDAGSGRRSSADHDGGASADRVILHVDMDAFFASVEVLDDPALLGLPVIVGGAGARGVVAACTYEARMFGIHSAMPSGVARRLCPSAVFVHGRFERYSEESKRLHAILDSISPLVEGISLDEAFVDVTGVRHLLGDGATIAERIRFRVASEMRLSCSVGVGRSKLVAKLASKAAKPVADRNGVRPGRGVVVVPESEELEFLHALPVQALWGVGRATGRRLEGLGVTTVGDMAALPLGTLERAVGAAVGGHLARLSRGDDPRPVVPERAAKSIGHEETFARDIWDRTELHRRLAPMVEASANALRRSDLAARTVSIKVRYADFTTITRSHSLKVPIDAGPAVAAVAGALLDSVDLSLGIRLLGVSLSGFGQRDRGVQLTFDLDPERAGLGKGDSVGREGGAPEQGRDPIETVQRSWESVSDALDAIRARYGDSSVGPASLVGAEGLRIRRRGDAQWGPRALPGRSEGDDRRTTE